MKIIETMPMTIMGVQARTYRMGDCRIIVSKEHGKWHLSISCKDRYPVWQEIKQARYELLPDQCMMAMLLPPKEEYVNLHQNTFHLHEIER